MLPPDIARLARLARRSSRFPPLDCAETCELDEALCGEAGWLLAAEMYGVGPALRDHPGDPVGAALAARSFGCLVAANPHVADWFFVFAPRPGVERELADALAGATPTPSPGPRRPPRRASRAWRSSTAARTPRAPRGQPLKATGRPTLLEAKTKPSKMTRKPPRDRGSSSRAP